MNMLQRKAGETGCGAGRKRAAAFALAVLGLALGATAARAQTGAPQPALKAEERKVLEQHVQGLLAESIRRRAARPVAATAVEHDARRISASLTDRALREAFDREDASALIDTALAKTASAAPTL